jgi:hypothetical protein
MQILKINKGRYNQCILLVFSSDTSDTHGMNIKLQNNTYYNILMYLTFSNPIFLPPAYPPALVYFGLERGWWITCPYYMRKSVGQALTAKREKKRNKKMCQTSSDIGAEQENHNVGRGPTLDWKRLMYMQQLGNTN